MRRELKNEAWQIRQVSFYVVFTAQLKKSLISEKLALAMLKNAYKLSNISTFRVVQQTLCSAIFVLPGVGVQA